MKSTRIKQAYLAILVVATTTLGSGCVVRARGRASFTPVVVIQDDPPPPRMVVVQSRPGFVWVEGRWHRNNNGWQWHDGQWQRERAQHQWVQGRWDRGPRGHVWIEGHWQFAGGGRPGNGNNRGPAVRDHR
jgi:hypothetical protein